MTDFLPSIIVSKYLTKLDIFVIILILLITIFVVIYGHIHRPKNTDKLLDYLLMGRRLTLPLFVATLSATWYGGIFGVNEITFNYGIYNFITQGVFWYIAYIIFALFLVPKIKKQNSMTLPDLATQLFGKRARTTTAIFTFFNILPISYVLSLGLFLQLVFGISLLPAMILGTFFVCLYSAWGGLRAVVFSDIVQFSVMCISVLLVVIFSVNTFGGLAFLQNNLPTSHFSLTGGNSWFNTLAWAGIALATLVDPSFYQRCFAAESAKTARNGILICTFIWFCFDLCTTTGALYARAILPTATPTHAYFLYTIQLLPSGLRGFFVAGILCIILSTLDSFLFIATNTLAYDLLKNKVKNKIYLNQIFFFIVGFIAILLALVFKGSFKNIWFIVGSYLSACLLVPMMFGYLFPKRFSDKFFVFSAWFSAFFVTCWNFFPRQNFWANIEGFYIGIIINIGLFSFALWYNKNEE